MSPAQWAQLIELILGLLCALLTYWLAQRGLRELLERTVAVPGGVVFYRRAFLLILVFGAIAETLGSAPDLKPGAQFMEYVWAVASGVGSALVAVLLTLGVYVLLMTILVAAIKPRHE